MRRHTSTNLAILTGGGTSRVLDSFRIWWMGCGNEVGDDSAVEMPIYVSNTNFSDNLLEIIS
jgi:hypothetical protein